jgi:hypothetical protein
VPRSLCISLSLLLLFIFLTHFSLKRNMSTPTKTLRIKRRTLMTSVWTPWLFHLRDV